MSASPVAVRSEASTVLTSGRMFRSTVVSEPWAPPPVTRSVTRPSVALVQLAPMSRRAASQVVPAGASVERRTMTGAAVSARTPAVARPTAAAVHARFRLNIEDLLYFGNSSSIRPSSDRARR